MRPVAVTLALALAIASSGCDTGTGSRRPPFLADLPGRFLAGVVRDADGKPVVNATVGIVGSGRRAVSARDGRFELADPPLGTGLLTVDGSTATADGLDLLGSFAIRIDVLDGRRELDRPLVVPDLAAGTTADVPLGSQAVPLTIDGTTASGAVLTLAAGAVVDLPGATGGSVPINLSRVDREDLPVALPPGTGARLPTRGIWISPVALTFAGAVGLSLPNDLALPASAKAELWWLDPASGGWVPAGLGTVAAGGQRIALDVANVGGGGLFVFTADIAQTTFLSGRVIDENAGPVRDAVVSAAGGIAGRSDANGFFRIGPLPAVDGSGAPLTLSVVVTGGIGWLPLSLEGPVPGNGDIVLPTVPGGLVRSLVAGRGRALVERPVRFGGGVGFAGAALLSDGEGIAEYREVPAGRFGAWASYTEDDKLYRGLARGELRAGDRSLDFQVLVLDEEARAGEFGGRARAIVLDGRSGAPIEKASVQGRSDPNTGDKGETDSNGELVVGGERYGEFTAAFESHAGDAMARSAVTLAHVDNGRLEFPLDVARRPPIGAFDRHALLGGRLLGTTAGPKSRQLLVRPRYRENDWWNLVLAGETLGGTLPRRIDPAVSGGDAFLVGLPLVRASVTAVEGTTTGGVFVPERLGALADLGTAAGETLAADIDLSRPLDRTLTLAAVLDGLDPALPASALRYRLAARFPDGHVLDLLPTSGGVLVGGPSAGVPVPSTTGILAGATYLVELAAEATQGGVTRTQALYTPAAGDSVEPEPFLAVPAITSPAPGSTTPSATEVTVAWTQPPGTEFFVLELTSVVGDDARTWTVMLPDYRNSYTFRRLVPAAPEILAPGRTWTLRLSAFRISRGIAFGRWDDYQRLSGNLFSLPPGERGIGARASWTQQFSTP